MNYINQNFKDPDDQELIEVHDDLLISGVMDSMGMMRLIAFIEETFQIAVPPEDMTVENFTSVQNITDYLSGRLQE